MARRSSRLQWGRRVYPSQKIRYSTECHIVFCTSTCILAANPTLACHCIDCRRVHVMQDNVQSRQIFGVNRSPADGSSFAEDAARLYNDRVAWHAQQRIGNRHELETFTANLLFEHRLTKAGVIAAGTGTAWHDFDRSKLLPDIEVIGEMYGMPYLDI